MIETIHTSDGRTIQRYRAPNYNWRAIGKLLSTSLERELKLRLQGARSAGFVRTLARDARMVRYYPSALKRAHQAAELFQRASILKPDKGSDDDR